MPAGQQATAAGGAGRRADVGVAKEDATAGDRIEVRGLDDVVDAPRSVDFGKQRGVAAPVVREQKQDIRRFSRPAEDRHHETAKQPNRKNMEQTTCHRSSLPKP